MKPSITVLNMTQLSVLCSLVHSVIAVASAALSMEWMLGKRPLRDLTEQDLSALTGHRRRGL